MRQQQRLQPAVAFDPLNEHFLATWHADGIPTDTAEPPGFIVADGEFEIFGKRIASDGQKIKNTFRISQMGPDEDAAFDAIRSGLTCGGNELGCLVVWDGNDNTLPMVLEELEIFGRFNNLQDDPAPTPSPTPGPTMTPSPTPTVVPDPGHKFNLYLPAVIR